MISRLTEGHIPKQLYIKVVKKLQTISYCPILGRKAVMKKQVICRALSHCRYLPQQIYAINKKDQRILLNELQKRGDIQIINKKFIRVL